MNIGLGFYEIFARIIPGAFYLVALVQIAFIFKLTSLDYQTFNDLGLIPSLGLAVIAYILGSVFYPISIVWNRFFKPRQAPDLAFREFKKRNPGWKFEFEGNDWRTLFAYIRKEDPHIAGEIDKQYAFYLMLGSLSFAILLLVINQVLSFLLGGAFISLLYAALLLIASILTGRESRFFQTRFYHWIFETILSYQLKPDYFVKREESPAPDKIKKK
jgi:hypothetical protein